MKEVIETAVNLWAEQIKGGVQDNGDGMQSMLSQMLKNQVQVTEQQIDKFKEVLSGILDVEFKAKDRVILSTDYQPDQTLSFCCTASGLDANKMPIKSVMWIYKDKVNYKFGYSAQIEEISFNPSKTA